MIISKHFNIIPTLHFTLMNSTIIQVALQLVSVLSTRECVHSSSATDSL